MKSTIAIIGATGKMGSALSGRLARAGYPLLLMGREKEKLQQMAEEMRRIDRSLVEAVGCAKEAAWEADIIIPAVPYTVQAEVAEHIRPVAIGKIVLSIINPFLKGANALLTAPGSSAAEELQSALPHSKIVKAFSTTLASSFGMDVIGDKADCWVAGDDRPSIDIVWKLVNDTGFRPVVAGNLDASRKLESMMLSFSEIM